MHELRRVGWAALGFGARVAALLTSLALVTGSALTGCSEDYGQAPGGTGSQVSVAFWTTPLQPEVWLLVVDDAAGSAELRAGVAVGVAAEAEWKLTHSSNSCGAHLDPAELMPIDWSVVVVHPSASGDARFTSPADDPRLRWRADRPTREAAATLVEGVKAALEALPAEPGPFALLESLKDMDGLLRGDRAATTPGERELLQALPADVSPLPLLAAARDDASPSEPEENVVPDSWRILGAVAPRLDPAPATPSCQFAKEPVEPRLGRWLELQQSGVWLTWPCAGALFNSLHVAEDCAPSCYRFQPVEDDAGAAACLLLVETSASACDPGAGWLDPLDDDGVRRPRTVSVGGATLSVCEIRQLEGDSLAKCRSDLACDGCEAGFCLTDLPQLMEPCSPSAGHALPMRFIAGARTAAPARGTLTCNVTRAP